jgi:hypothetical protein
LRRRLSGARAITIRASRLTAFTQNAAASSSLASIRWLCGTRARMVACASGVKAAG